MDGRVNRGCEAVKGILTEALLLSQPLSVDAECHLASCCACREEADGVLRTIATLAAVDRSIASAPASPVPRLTRRVQTTRTPAADSRAAGAHPHRARVRSFLLVGVSIAILAGAVVVPGLVGDDQAPLSVVSIQRTGRMVHQPWGTEVPVSLAGLRPGRTYRLMAADVAGRRMPGGSVNVATSQPIRLQIATAMSKESITTLLVEDQDGQLVASVAVPPLAGG